MRVKIHWGTKEGGGSCIALEAQDTRILLDVGLPLDGDAKDSTLHPQIEGLQGGGNLLALVLSLTHLAHLAGPELPIALGAATHHILKAAHHKGDDSEGLSEGEYSAHSLRVDKDQVVLCRRRCRRSELAGRGA
jgi:Cft2 family RNA processing exonuclease